MTQQEYNLIVDKFVEDSFEEGILAFKNNYQTAMEKTRKYMAGVLRKRCMGDVKKLKCINGENVKLLNAWLKKNDLIPVMYT